jgi:hypothetical protein
VDERWIDTVAREMTEAMPPADLRARVLSRIAQDKRTKKALAWWLAPAAIALAAATALVATVWPRWQAEAPLQNQSALPAPPPTGAREAIPSEPEPAPMATDATSPVRAQRTAPGARGAYPVAAPDTIALAPPPLTVAAIPDEPIAIVDSPAIGSLQIGTLGFTRLEIEPLGYQGDFQ